MKTNSGFSGWLDGGLIAKANSTVTLPKMLRFQAFLL
jgi:hypothetical protein